MNFNIAEILQKYSENTAFICGKDSLTYAELFSRAQALGAVLKNQSGSTAAIFGSKNTASFVAIIACLLAKKAYLPIDFALPKERVDKIISLSEACVLIDCTGEDTVLKPVNAEPRSAGENENAYIIFTSGSTGTPKGVPISYENLNNFIDWITKLEPLSGYEHASVLSHASFSFDLSTAAIFYALSGGHTLVQLSDTEDFAAIFDTMAKNKTSVIVATPTFLRMLLLNKEFSEAKYPFLKCIYFCGETLQKSLCKAVFERFSKIRIINAYGPTEATSAVSAYEITPKTLETEEILPVGNLSTAACEIYEENGELVLKGKSVFKGYLGICEKTEDFRYRTGDLGCIRNGKIYCKGRADAQIKYKGYRIELGDIEENISEIEGVISAAVIAKKTPENEVKLIKAYYCGDVTEEELRQKLSEKLPGYMLPKVIKKLAEMPVNRNGKTDRKKLEAL